MPPLVRVLAEDARLRELALGAVEAMGPTADLQPDPPAGGARLLPLVRRLRQAMARGQEPVPALLVLAADRDRTKSADLQGALEPSSASEPRVPWQVEPVLCTPWPCAERWILLDPGCLREATGTGLDQEYALPKARRCPPYKQLLGDLLAAIDPPSGAVGRGAEDRCLPCLWRSLPLAATSRRP